MTATAAVDRFADQRVTVIGDVMLDVFQVGRVERISPEAPVPVVRFEHEDLRLGGAANVAHNLAALGATANLLGVVGDDAAGRQLGEVLDAAGISREWLVADSGRPTTRKVRIVTTRNQQVARVDHESDAAVSGAALDTLLAGIDRAAAASTAVVLSDYRKGVVVPGVIERAVTAARSAGIPLVVDPKVPVADRYRGATVVTPNHHEAELMTHTAIRTSEDARATARWIHERTEANVLITWGERGMWILDGASDPAEEAALTAATREVADVTGAGDTVVGVLSLGLAAGASLMDAARLANLAAGVVVSRFGPAAPTTAELRAAVVAAEPA